MLQFKLIKNFGHMPPQKHLQAGVLQGREWAFKERAMRHEFQSSSAVDCSGQFLPVWAGGSALPILSMCKNKLFESGSETKLQHLILIGVVSLV